VWQHVTREQHGGLEVETRHLADALSRQVYEGVLRADTGVVDPDIDVPELEETLLDQTVDLTSVEQVGSDPAPADLVGQSRETISRSRDDENPRSPLGETPSEVGADPVRGASDDDVERQVQSRAIEEPEAPPSSADTRTPRGSAPQ
jgi:hypothetical protein